MTEVGDLFNSKNFVFKVIGDGEAMFGNDTYNECNGFVSRGLAIGIIKIPSYVNDYTITVIGKSSFYRCIEIKRIILPNTIKSIEERSISDINIEELIIPASVLNIGDRLDYLYRCKSFVFEEGSRLQTIGNYFLTDSNQLEEIVFPHSLKSIGNFFLTNSIKKGVQPVENCWISLKFII